MRISRENIGDCSVKLYRSGMYVIQSGSRKGQNTEKLLEMARMKKKYRVSRQKVKSSCLELWRCKRSKHLLFVTYTFAFDINEEQASHIWRNHLDNLKKTFKVANYVWVKEKQTKNNNRIHFHLLADTNRINIVALQDSFNHSVINNCGSNVISNNSVRLGDNPVVRSIKSIANYLSKYISKEIQEFDSKAYGSTDMILYREMDFCEFSDLANKKTCFVYCDEPYLKIGVIKNFYDLPPT